MARPRGDHDERRREVAGAVWRVLSRGGFGALSLRAVAAELGGTTGVVTHYFADKDALVHYAIDVLAEQTHARRRLRRDGGLAALRAALHALLPLDEESRAMNRVWVSSWDIALADTSVAKDHALRYRAGRERLRDLVSAAQDAGELAPGDPAGIAAALHAFVLGLVVQAVLDPPAFPPQTQIAYLDAQLELLG